MNRRTADGFRLAAVIRLCKLDITLEERIANLNAFLDSIEAHADCATTVLSIRLVDRIADELTRVNEEIRGDSIARADRESAASDFRVVAANNGVGDDKTSVRREILRDIWIHKIEKTAAT